MSLFAEHGPRPPDATPIEGLTIREASEGDLERLTAISADREGGNPDHHRAGFETLLRDQIAGDALVLVGEARGEILGFGKVARFRHGEDPPADIAPEGWYLAGVIVRPEWRRRGVARCLTVARMEWIAHRATRAYYFVNARNLVSIELHGSFGFVEFSRRFTFPGATFVGGEGILFQADLAPASR